MLVCVPSCRWQRACSLLQHLLDVLHACLQDSQGDLQLAAALEPAASLSFPSINTLVSTNIALPLLLLSSSDSAGCSGLPKSVSNAAWPTSCKGAPIGTQCIAECSPGYAGAVTSTCTLPNAGVHSQAGANSRTWHRPNPKGPYLSAASGSCVKPGELLLLQAAGMLDLMSGFDVLSCMRSCAA
jgi:hypothetical protein